MTALNGLAEVHGIDEIFQRTPRYCVVEDTVGEMLCLIEGRTTDSIQIQRGFTPLTFQIKRDLRLAGSIQISRHIFSVDLCCLHSVSHTIMAHHSAAATVIESDNSIITRCSFSLA